MKNLHYKAMIPLLITLMLVSSVMALSTIVIHNSGNIADEGTATLTIGINYLSAGNAWTDSNTQLQQDFSRFANDGVHHLSIRIMWSVMMPTKGVLSTTAVNNVQRVLDMANQYDIKVNLDFWAQFGYTLGYPTSWAGSNYYSLLEEPYQSYYLDYQTQVVNRFKNHPAIESWSILNEPYYSTSSQKIPMQNLIHNCVQNIRANDNPNHDVICRFTLSYTPASGRYDISVYNDFNTIAITEYLDPNNPSDTRYNGRWSYWVSTVDYCKQTGKQLWVIEFGDNSADQTHNQIHYRDSLLRFEADGVNRAYAWAWQTRSASSESFNIYDGSNPYPSYFELIKYGA